MAASRPARRARPSLNPTALPRTPRSPAPSAAVGDKALETAPDFQPPKSMGMGKWFTYLKNVISLSPVPKGTKMKLGDVPPGVKVLGGTYAIDGEPVGVLGVIGPTRMDYERVIPVVDVTAKLLGAALKSG